MGNRIAFVSTLPPEPLMSGFSMRIQGLMKHVPAHLEVLRVYPPGPSERYPADATFQPRKVSRVRELLSLTPQIVLPYRSSPDRSEVWRRIREFDPDLVVLSGLHVFPMAPPEYPVLYDSHNVEWHSCRGLIRYSSDSLPLSLHRRVTMWKLRRWENARVLDNAFLVACSNTDAEYFSELRGEPVPVVYNGAEMEYWSMERRPEEGLLLFSGDLSYYPNVDAALYMVRRVIPMLRRRGWSGRLVLAGRDPVRSVRALAGEDVVVTGTVEDMREYYARAQVMLAPMRIGSGTPLKVITAMASGLPVVTNPRIARSLGLAGSGVLQEAETAEDVAGRVLDLTRDRGLAGRVASEGRRVAEQRFSWRAMGTAFWSLVTDVLAAGPRART